MSDQVFAVVVLVSLVASVFLARAQYQVHKSKAWAAVTYVLATVELTALAVIASAFMQFFA